MGQLDEVSQSIGSLNAKVDILLGAKGRYDSDMTEINKKISEVHTFITAHDLPAMKKEVEDMKKRKWVMMGAAAGAGGTAGGLLPWLKGVLGHLL